MKTIFSVTLLLAALFLATDAVQIIDGDDSFSLESVRVLQELAVPFGGMAVKASPRVFKTSYGSVCAHPTLPQEFVPLCQQEGAAMRLARLCAVPMDVCEICAFVACTGCS
ncbi:guanylin family protein [Clupea harengus]|uniref:Guanylate cyclase activator 2B n=1 Tax=Clupea harengus TaxID=7950 RepID=A0A6P3VWJ7_CLUHA|nr:guanylin family protein [Clupea harengus]